MEVASIAFVWSPAQPPPAFRLFAGRCPTPHFYERLEAIKELAKRSGMSMSDYVTACCLGKQVVVVDGLKEVLKELKSIGRNLNQLVTLAHMGRITVVNLDSVRQAFSELCAAVRLILERKRW